MNHEQLNALSLNIKERIMRGQEPSEAVPEAVTELSLTVEAQVIEKLVEAFKTIKRLSIDPQFIAKQKALDSRIRKLMREGLTVSKAVMQGQDDTGVKLSEQGQRILIDLLEQESEKVRGLRIETISDEEYAEIVNKRCMFFQQDGQDGWRCCQCQTLRAMNVTTCPCGHERCSLN